MLTRLKTFNYVSAKHSPILIIGGGSAGLNVQAILLRDGHCQPNQIKILEPKQMHAYQPGWTMVGGGFYDVQKTFKPMKDLYHRGVELVPLHVTKIIPEDNTVITEDQSKWTYDQLVIAPGNRLDWGQIKGKNLNNFKKIGAQQALDDQNCPVASIYWWEYAVKMNKIAESFKGKNAIFTEPQMPIKCGGAPQKILYLTHDRFKKKNIQAEFEFHKTVAVCFAVPKYNAILEELIKSKGIKLNLKSKLVEVRGNDRVAVFEDQDSKKLTEKQFDLLHLVPPQVPPTFIKESGLADQSGYVNVDKHTLQHVTYRNIWSIGDASNLPTSKTAAAVISQSPVLAANLAKVWKQNQPATAQYHGYTSCPIFTSQRSLLIAEFKYNNELDESFWGLLQGRSLISFYIKKLFFPFAYWQLMPRGIWGGRDLIRITKGA